MPEYTGKKRFQIRPNDAGLEVYRDEYVEWLLREVKALKAENTQLKVTIALFMESRDA